MRRKKLSERQRFILEFIRDFVREHGYAPSIREIKSAVEKIFGVKVDTVRTVNVAGKLKRVGRYQGRRNAWKKAYVRVAAGEKEIVFEDTI